HVPPLPAAAPARPAAAAHAAGRRRAAGPPRAVAAHPHRAPRGGEPGDRPARAGRGALLREALAESGKSATEIVKIWGGGAERALQLVREVRGEALFDAALAAGKGVI